MNSLTVAGNLSKDAEMRTLPNGDPVISFSVADNMGKDKGAIFWNAQMFGKRATALQPYLVKGQSVTVSGTVTEREWTDKEGGKRKTMEIRVNEIVLQGGKREHSEPTYAPAPRQAPANAATAGFSPDDSDVPF